MKLILDDGKEYEIKNVRSLDVRDGDVIVYNIDDKIRPTSTDRLRAATKELFGAQTDVLILSDGIDISILRRKGGGQNGIKD